MKLYMHPASTTCRPILMFLAENHIDCEMQVVDLMTGAQHKPDYAAINPNCLVPTLQDGDFTLTESATILRYLADKHETPDYPKNLQARARINERMDWFNSNLYKDLGYNLVYPQLFPHHKRASDAGQEATLEWGVTHTKHWLSILNEHMLGNGTKYLCGDNLTIADYFGGCLLELGKVIRCDYSAYPNVEAWLARMREVPSWNTTHEVIYGFSASLKDKPFKAV